MSSEWPEYSLLEIYNVTNGLSKNRKEFGFGYPFLTFKEVFANYFVPEELTSLANTDPKERNKCSIQAGDVFITRTSETFDELGMSCVATKDYPNASFNGFCKRLRPNGTAEIDAQYSAFFFNGPEFRQQVLSLANMSTRASLNNDMLKKLTIKLPPLDVQRGIAKVLTDLHDKIRINNQINQTLEQMAQAIFKSWFVDFEPAKAKIAALEAGGSEEVALLTAMQAISGKSEAQLTRLQAERPEQYAELRATAELFPSAMQDSELGEIPEGWEISSIYGICDVIYGAPFKSKLFNQNSDGIPLIRIRDLKNERPGVSTPERHPKGYLVQNGDLLVGMDGEFKPYIWGSGPAWMNQRVCCFKPRNGYAEGLVRGFIEPQLRERELTATATTVIHLGKGDIDRFSFLNAGEDLLHTFSKIVDPLYKKVVSNKTSNYSLEQLRGTLLPKLLSGELSVSATEDRLAELANV